MVCRLISEVEPFRQRVSGGGWWKGGEENESVTTSDKPYALLTVELMTRRVAVHLAVAIILSEIGKGSTNPMKFNGAVKVIYVDQFDVDTRNAESLVGESRVYRQANFHIWG